MKHQREHWASRLGFVMAAIGSAIGLGTLWQFPYVTGENGGGAFVLFYLFFTLVIGVPILMAELILGRRAQRGVVGIFSVLAGRSENWRILGWLNVLSPLLILSYYNVVAGWGLNYVLLSLDQFYLGRTPDQIKGVFDIMYRSGDVCIFFQLLFTLIVIAIVWPGIQKGIEYWSRIMMTLLFIILGGLFIYSCTLEGFGESTRFLLSFNAEKLKPSSILQAMGLSFFTLSVGQGVMLTYGSYMKGDVDIPKTAFIVGVADIVISLLAAMMIFPVVFTFNFPPDQEAGLIFKTLPVLFAKLPGALILSTTFFVLFSFAALTSAIALFEVIVANFIDLYGWSRRRSILVSGIAVFVLGIPSALAGTGALFPSWTELYQINWFQTVNQLVSVWLLPIIGLCIALFAGWFLPVEELRNEFNKGTVMTGLFACWRFFLRWVIPIAIVLVILEQSNLIKIDNWF